MKHFRSTLIMAGALMLASPAFAEQSQSSLQKAVNTTADVTGGVATTIEATQLGLGASAARVGDIGASKAAMTNAKALGAVGLAVGAAGAAYKASTGDLEGAAADTAGIAAGMVVCSKWGPQGCLLWTSLQAGQALGEGANELSRHFDSTGQNRSLNDRATDSYYEAYESWGPPEAVHKSLVNAESGPDFIDELSRELDPAQRGRSWSDRITGNNPSGWSDGRPISEQEILDRVAGASSGPGLQDVRGGPGQPPPEFKLDLSEIRRAAEERIDRDVADSQSVQLQQGLGMRTAMAEASFAASSDRITSQSYTASMQQANNRLQSHATALQTARTTGIGSTQDNDRCPADYPIEIRRGSVKACIDEKTRREYEQVRSQGGPTYGWQVSSGGGGTQGGSSARPRSSAPRSGESIVGSSNARK